MAIYDVEIYSCSKLREIIIQEKGLCKCRFSLCNERISICELFEEKRTKSEKLYRLACQSFIKSARRYFTFDDYSETFDNFEIHLE